jgi:hypothetical protein
MREYEVEESELLLVNHGKEELWKWNCGTLIWLEKYYCNY